MLSGKKALAANIFLTDLLCNTIAYYRNRGRGDSKTFSASGSLIVFLGFLLAIASTGDSDSSTGNRWEQSFGLDFGL
jgi:hypothetical protein